MCEHFSDGVRQVVEDDLEISDDNVYQGGAITTEVTYVFEKPTVFPYPWMLLSNCQSSRQGHSDISMILVDAVKQVHVKVKSRCTVKLSQGSDQLPFNCV